MSLTTFFTIMLIKLIYAKSINGVIGCNGKLPWHIAEDLTHFKAVTAGCTILMGRKTWDSLPEKYRPLPGRKNVVITRQRKWSALGAYDCNSVSRALKCCKNDEVIWVIGGGEVYKEMLPHANEVVVTTVLAECQGDTYAPMLDDEWSGMPGDIMTTTSGIEMYRTVYTRRTK